ADHLIEDVAAFHASLELALPLARAGKLVTFGITPTSAHTGYGYLERGAAVGEGGYRVKRFVEKPDAATAAGYVASGAYCWNS
ncbi:sugar phosphate nucleotidyltransferase, partial [Klebsiella pneumoniae]|uniref:sugar phosphate nucleotidyltransferase n=1 Tax=Klebsiella pneumoniae TaxID=573 RepID=UPI00272EEB42